MSSPDETPTTPAHAQDAAPDASPAETPPTSSARPRRWPGKAAVVVAAALAFGAGMCVAGPGPAHEHAGEAAEAREWTCPMHPQIRQSGPGTCPLCGMALVPVDAAARDDDGGDARITLSERARILARVRTSEVARMAAPGRQIRLLGRVDIDETRMKTVTAWTAGRVDQLLVSTTGQRIRAGQPIARLYSPEIYAAHGELIQAARQVERLAGAGEATQAAARSLLSAARQRLRLLGVPAAELDAMERADAPTRSITIRAPVGGTVLERAVSQGAYVDAGTPLYRVADLTRLWVQLDAYETDVPLLSVGDEVTLTITGLPGERVTGKVAFIDPVVDARRRTSRVRVEVANAGGRLRPGMFAEAALATGDASAPRLMIPDTAPLHTGQRSIVYVEVPDAERPTYEAREVVLGPRAGAMYPVLSGLEPGERVVTRGAFVIDADLQIKGGSSMMTRDDDPARRAQVAELPASVARDMAAILAAYLGAQEALAADDLAGARAAAGGLVDAVLHISAAVPDELRSHWDELGAELQAHARALSRSEAMPPARKAFEHLSAQVVTLLERFGNPTGEAVKLAHCPMAFNGRGATWVQRQEVIANSYFGAQMLTCGEVRDTVAPGARAGSASRPASTGHVH